MLYVTRLFTDRVAGVGSTLKHAIGRRRMLADVAAKLRLAREHSAKAPMNPASTGIIDEP